MLSLGLKKSLLSLRLKFTAQVWYSILMFIAECDTSQLSRCPSAWVFC